MPEHSAYLGHYEAAVQHFVRQQFSEANQHCTQALALRPDNSQCLHLSASIAEAMRMFPQAQAAWQKAVNVDPKDIAARFGLAKTQKKLKNTAEAISSYTAAFSMLFNLNTKDAPLDCMRGCMQAVIDRAPALGQAEADRMIEFGVLLEGAGLYERGGADLVEFAARSLAEGKIIAFQVVLIIHALAFKIASSRKWNVLVFERLVRPSLEAEARAGRHRIALDLETLIYMEFIRQEETEENFRAHYASLIPILREAGLRARDETLPEVRGQTSGRPVIAFLLPAPSLLAHTQVLLAYLEGYRQLPEQPLLPRIYIFKSRDPQCERRLNEAGAEVVMLDEVTPETRGNVYQRLLALRRLLNSDNVTCLVWVSSPVLMAFASALEMAPVQIWWSMKYHGIETPELDGYVTGGSLARTKIISGKLWRTAPVAYAVQSDPTAAQKAAELRSQFSKYRLLVGTLAREQKLTDPQFLDAIIRILRIHKDVAYLWTGRARLHSVQSAFENAGVADRCYFVGWVDTKVYAHLLDIFLDSFPFPCTFTLLEAMAAGKAAVLYQSEESYRTGIHGILSPALNDLSGDDLTCRRVREIFRGRSGRSLFLCAQNSQEYVTFADELIMNSDLRHEVGKALKQVVNEYFVHKSAMAEGYTRHFMEIIVEKIGQNSHGADGER